MKRDRYAKDYDQVRKRAAMVRTEFFDPDEPAEHTTAARVRAMADEAIERLDGRSEGDIRRAAERKVESDALSARANESLRLAAFDAAGVEPPIGMKVSLALLLQIGWTIGDIGGRRVLFRPVHTPAPRKVDEDQSAESLKEGF
jgi:hypothetical protein